LKILIVGCGSIGKRHAINSARATETAVFDERQDLAEQLSHELGIQQFSSLKDGLSWKPDGVIIATPNNFHIPVASVATESGADVLIEKPILNSSHNTQQLIYADPV